MTDRGRAALRLTAESFTVGPSCLRWEGERLVIEIDEMSTPHAQPLRGTITVAPTALTDVEVPLTPDGAHVWRPFAPTAGIKVDLNRPGWRWDGHGYLDANFGTRALEADFGYWTWGRFPVGDGSVAFYDAARTDGSQLSVALRFGADGSCAEIEAPPLQRFRRSNWLVRRETRCDAGHAPRQVKAMLDAPFYNRCAVETVIGGERTVGVFEALDLDRFRGPWLMPMLAVRVPRRAGWRFPE
ncbi:carotenoid 1,2-hydratase [Jannaschia seohaensis]|uniref:Carotenoid 1,2-hydratase n=2 Tax=Jannaschia seohaensis TaxID=475081 RepID=A0A2Y9A757_9RHOB|nr:carotenoid 1,2-hydratase [Jannaschia seohaensis]PWJ21729.1 carotenoid 1,2-hydratase [Jannaschia seohaensis]SSA38007.1 carotenoid 1,2-hydratase [Jannaschia seohaensis]